ncbi:MAG TPA: hypothetical protein VEU28_00355 [Actinomycetota bacterium]|nr:hypothetical protein [Actinomycetota bacterium]
MRTSRYTDSGGRAMGSSARMRREGDAAEMAERYVYTPETKEFFRTSEFLLWLLAIVGVFIAAGVNEEFDAKSAWTVFTILTTGYIVSRGLAKAGTRRGWSDPYWEADAQTGYSDGAATSGAGIMSDRTYDLGDGRSAGRTADQAADRLMEEVRTPETKEFFRTSEFVMWLLGVAGILVASAYETGFGASSAWTLVTVLSSGYILSRSIAKAGTARGVEAGAARRYGRLSEASTPETKESFRTSELGVLLLTVVGILLASGADGAFDAIGAWRLIAGVATTYMIARGIAKIGTPQETDGRRTMIA